MRPLPLVTTGLLLAARERRESDLVVELYTHHRGRLTALARGARRSRKRFVGLLLTGHDLELHLSPPRRGEPWGLAVAALRHHHRALREHWRRWLAAGPVLETLWRTTPHEEPQPRLLALARLTLQRLERATAPGEMASALVVYLVRLLRLLGHGLHLESCLRCQRPASRLERAFLGLEGGLLCPTCAGRSRAEEVPPGLVRGLAAAQTLESASLGRLGFPPALALQALAFLARFAQAQLERELPSLELARQALHGGPKTVLPG